MRISDWSSDVCSSDLPARYQVLGSHPNGLPAGAGNDRCGAVGWNPVGGLQAGWSARLRQRCLRARRWSTRSEEHTSELQSLMRISYAVFCLKKKKHYHINRTTRLYTPTTKMKTTV